MITLKKISKTVTTPFCYPKKMKGLINTLYSPLVWLVFILPTCVLKVTLCPPVVISVSSCKLVTYLKDFRLKINVYFACYFSLFFLFFLSSLTMLTSFSFRFIFPHCYCTTAVFTFKLIALIYPNSHGWVPRVFAVFEQEL